MKKVLIITTTFLLNFNLLANFSNQDLANLKFEEVKLNERTAKIEEQKEDLTKVKMNTKYGIISGVDEATYNIATIFKYYKTSTYEIFTRPNYTTTIKLNPDEEIVYVGGGNTENWNIDNTKGGNDGAEIIFIKPLFKNLKTNLSIITNKRTYSIYLVSSGGKYNPYIEWKYPYEQNIQFKINSKLDSDIKLKGNVEDLNFNYKYKTNSPISPLQVMTDGEKTIVVMNPKLQEMPVVYGYTQDNQLVQVNYRIHGNRIIIDKSLKRLQLILGKEIVEIYQVY